MIVHLEIVLFVKQELGKSSKRIGTQSLRILKANTPVKEGNLRRSWTAEGPSYSYLTDVE